MLTALTLFVLAGLVLVFILLAIVVVAMRQEPRGAELDTRAPSPIAAMVRRALGVYVRRPDTPANDEDPREGRWPERRLVTVWTKATTRPPDRRR